MKNNAKYRYYDVTPFGMDNEENCVTRAISACSGLSYNAVTNLLKLLSDYWDCDILNVNCYKHLLEDIFEYERIPLTTGETVGEFAKKHKYGKFLLRVPHHLTSVIHGLSYDIFDTTDAKITYAWRVE